MAGLASENWWSPDPSEASKNPTEVAESDPKQKFISLTWRLESGPIERTQHTEFAQHAAQVFLIRDD